MTRTPCAYNVAIRDFVLGDIVPDSFTVGTTVSLYLLAQSLWLADCEHLPSVTVGRFYLVFWQRLPKSRQSFYIEGHEAESSSKCPSSSQSREGVKWLQILICCESDRWVGVYPGLFFIFLETPFWDVLRREILFSNLEMLFSNSEILFSDSEILFSSSEIRLRWATRFWFHRPLFFPNFIYDPHLTHITLPAILPKIPHEKSKNSEEKVDCKQFQGNTPCPSRNTNDRKCWHEGHG